MLFYRIIFFLGVTIIFYSYIGYGTLLWIIVKVRDWLRGSRTPNVGYFFPPVTLVVAAYNEEDFITQKIENTLSLDYPSDRIQLIFITDGSTDNTPSIVSSYACIQHLHLSARGGKVAAMHRAMSFVNTPYVVFSDANTLLNKSCIKNIVRHYKNKKVGGVAGEKKIMQSRSEGIAGTGEGLYWKYESYLKKLDWQFYTVVGAAGELFSLRTELYDYPGNHILLDDFILSLSACKKGFRVAYEPDAYAMETPSTSLKEEQKRKIRISAGAFQSMYILRSLLNVFRYPKLSFQYISHRVLRWTLCPLFLALILISNFLIVVADNSRIYDYFLAAQLLFYTGGLLGWLLSLRNIRISFLYFMYYFIFMNFSLYLGFFRFLKGRQTVLWDKAERKKYTAKST